MIYTCLRHLSGISFFHGTGTITPVPFSHIQQVVQQMDLSLVVESEVASCSAVSSIFLSYAFLLRMI